MPEGDRRCVTWAIGDVHGRKRTLDALLERLRPDMDRDRLWLVGDLVNRGPDSAGVLRWARRTAGELGDRFACVLGNHDLHLLAAAAGLRAPDEDLHGVLDAPDAPQLLAWLRRRPLVHRHGTPLLVHAAVWPRWHAAAAETWARRVEHCLATSNALLIGAKEARAQPGELGQLGDALYAFTVLRMLESDGEPCGHKGPPEQAPAGCTPWFDVPARRSTGVHVVCGHWAALGLRLEDGVSALDSGAAWDGPLSAVRLEDRCVVQQANLESRARP